MSAARAVVRPAGGAHCASRRKSLGGAAVPTALSGLSRGRSYEKRTRPSSRRARGGLLGSSWRRVSGSVGSEHGLGQGTRREESVMSVGAFRLCSALGVAVASTLGVASPPAGAASSSVRVLDTSASGDRVECRRARSNGALSANGRILVFTSASTDLVSPSPGGAARVREGPGHRRCHPRLRERDGQRPPTAAGSGNAPAGVGERPVRDVQLRRDQPVRSGHRATTPTSTSRTSRPAASASCPRTPPGRRRCGDAAGYDETRRSATPRVSDDGDNGRCSRPWPRTSCPHIPPTGHRCDGEIGTLRLARSTSKDLSTGAVRALAPADGQHEPRRASRRSTALNADGSTVVFEASGRS